MAESKSFSIRSFIPEKVSANQAKYTCMAMVPICLLIAFFSKIHLMLDISIIFLESFDKNPQHSFLVKSQDILQKCPSLIIIIAISSCYFKL